MEIKIVIKSIFGNVLFEYSKEGNTIKDTIKEAIKCGADLRGADLRDADLRGAYLRGAGEITSVDDILFIGPIGSRADFTHIYRTNKGVYVKCGCFFGTVDEFASKVKVTHGDNKYGIEYRKIIDFAYKYFEKNE